MFCVQFSWNGGKNWAIARTTSTLGTSDVIYTLGSSSDLWNRTWLASEFSNANFKMRITPVSTSTSTDFFLDWLAVKVYYQP